MKQKVCAVLTGLLASTLLGGVSGARADVTSSATVDSKQYKALGYNRFDSAGFWKSALGDLKLLGVTAFGKEYGTVGFHLEQWRRTPGTANFEEVSEKLRKNDILVFKGEASLTPGGIQTRAPFEDCVRVEEVSTGTATYGETLNAYSGLAKQSHDSESCRQKVIVVRPSNCPGDTLDVISHFQNRTVTNRFVYLDCPKSGRQFCTQIPRDDKTGKVLAANDKTVEEGGSAPHPARVALNKVVLFSLDNENLKLREQTWGAFCDSFTQARKAKPSSPQIAPSGASKASKGR